MLERVVDIERQRRGERGVRRVVEVRLAMCIVLLHLRVKPVNNVPSARRIGIR